MTLQPRDSNFRLKFLAILAIDAALKNSTGTPIINLCLLLYLQFLLVPGRILKIPGVHSKITYFFGRVNSTPRLRIYLSPVIDATLSLTTYQEETTILGISYTHVCCKASQLTIIFHLNLVIHTFLKFYLKSSSSHTLLSQRVNPDPTALGTEAEARTLPVGY